MSSHGSSGGGGAGGSNANTAVLMLGNHKVTTLDDISRYSDLISSSFASLTDGRAEANAISQGLKSEAEIQAYTLDEKLTGLERIRFFLFHKTTTSLQRQVGLDSLVREVAIAVSPPRSTSPPPSPARSVDGAFAAAAAAASASTAPFAVPSVPSSAYTISEYGDRLLDSILPDLHKLVLSSPPGWDPDLLSKVASCYTSLLSTRVLSRARLETVVAPFLMRMLEGSTTGGEKGGGGSEEISEEYLDTWMQPFLACIDALGGPPAAAYSPPAPASASLLPSSAKSSASSSSSNVTSPHRQSIVSPSHRSSISISKSPTSAASQQAQAPQWKPSHLLQGSILDFSLKKGTQYLLSQPMHVRVMCVRIWGALVSHLDTKTVRDRMVEIVCSMCQDTSGSVRFQASKQLVTIIQALSPAGMHAKHSTTPLLPGSTCPHCPSLASQSSPDAPLALLLVELEELLKDEEREVKLRAFHTLIATLDCYPDTLRRTKVLPLLRNYIQLPPKGVLMRIASELGEMVWKLRGDLIPQQQIPGGSSAAPSGDASNIETSSLSSLVRTLLAFYKNLPFLSAHNAPELQVNSSVHSSHSGPLSPIAPSLLSPHSASVATAALAERQREVAVEPRRHCAKAFVAVLGVMGRSAVLGGAAASTGSSGSNSSISGGGSSTSSLSSSSPSFLALPEVRFFLDHLSSLWHKLLLKEEDTELKVIMYQSFFEVVTILGGLGCSLTRATTQAPMTGRAQQGLGNQSAWRLTKDAFLGVLHEAVPSITGASSSTNSTGTTTASSIGSAASKQPGSSNGSSNSPTSSSLSTSSASSSTLIYLLEGGKLESILTVYFQCHFGERGAPWIPAASTGAGSAASPTETTLDSWSSFLHDTLRTILQYESSLNSGYQWRTKVALLKAIHFLIKPPFAAPRGAGATAAGGAGHARQASNALNGPSTPSPLIGSVSHPLPRGHFFGSFHALHTVGDLNNYSLLWEKLLPCLLQHMHSSPHPLSLLSSTLLSSLLLSSPFSFRRSEAATRWMREFAGSRTQGDRMGFVEAVAKMMGLGTNSGDGDEHESVTAPKSTKLLSNRLFKKYFFPPLLQLTSDPVSNVRRKLVSSGLLQVARRMLPATLNDKGVSTSVAGTAASELCLHDIWLKSITNAKTLLATAQAEKEKAANSSNKSSTSSSSSSYALNSAVVDAQALVDALTAPPTQPSTAFEDNLLDASLEQQEDALLCLEETWLASPSHSSALIMSGGNVSYAHAALAQASNWSPVLWANANANSTTGGENKAGGANSGTNASSASVLASKMKRSSLGAGGLALPPDALSSSAAGAIGISKRKSANPDSMATMSAAASSAAVHAASAKNSAAVGASTLAPGAAGRIATSAKGAATGGKKPAGSTAGATGSAATNGTASASTGQPGGVTLAAPKAVRRFGATPAAPATGTTASVGASAAAAPNSIGATLGRTGMATGAGASRPPVQPSSSPQPTSSVNLLGKRTIDPSAPATSARASSNPSSPALGPTSLPSSAAATTAPTAAPLGTRPNRGMADWNSAMTRGSGAATTGAGTSAAAGALQPQRKDSRDEDTKHASAEDDPFKITRAGSASGHHSTSGAMGTGAPRPRPTPVAVRSSKLLSANLSLSAARIVASSGGGGGGSSITSAAGNGTSPAASPPHASFATRPSSLTPGSSLLLSNGRTSPAPHSATATSSSAAAAAAVNRGPRGNRTSLPRDSSGSNITHGSGSASDRSAERDATGAASHHHSSSCGNSTHVSGSHLQSGSSLLTMGTDHHGSGASAGVPVAGRRAGARSAAPAVQLPKLDAPSNGASAAGGAHSSPHVAPPSTSAVTSKLYSKEPLAHAHLRKFKLAQRSPLPTEDQLRKESAAPEGLGGVTGVSATGGVSHARKSSRS